MYPFKIETKSAELTLHLYCGFPDGLHGDGDETGDCIGNSQMEHNVVHISKAPPGKISK